jgi:POT family proton-dependent oligopeptide transporter
VQTPQYQNARPVLQMLKSEEKVVVDPELTIQKLFMWFYRVVNVGAFLHSALSILMLSIRFSYHI